jgi:transcriptional repressor NrdR
MYCPFCKSNSSRVIDTDQDRKGGIRRRRECRNCSERYTTYERAVKSLPYLIKQDGRREDFDRDKLERGIRVACAKRAVTSNDISRLVGEVESTLLDARKTEISSRVVGDIVIEGLKLLDQIAYIRYAIVYLGLSDLQSVREEIDRLLV